MVEEHRSLLDPPSAILALRNPHADEEAVREILDEKRLLAFYEVRKELAGHPATPRPRALQLVGGLYWRDLVAVSRETRVAPAVRRAAERRILDRIPGLALGEKIAIARRASRMVQQALGKDSNPRVVKALLENPRLTTGVLLPIVSRGATAPPVLAAVAEDRRWGSRYPIKVAIARNPKTPVATALRLVSSLKKGDLRALTREPRINDVVRRRAKLHLGQER